LEILALPMYPGSSSGAGLPSFQSLIVRLPSRMSPRVV
jgi:hypothetical protein